MVALFANSGNPDQTPHTAASDLGLHCLPITLLGISRLQWVKSNEHFTEFRIWKLTSLLLFVVMPAYCLYQTGLTKQCRPRSGSVTNDQGLHCLHTTMTFSDTSLHNQMDLFKCMARSKCTAPNKRGYQVNSFSYFCMKIYVVGNQ